MTIDVATFRANFPEFGSSTTYPNAQVQFWLNTAYNFVNADRWGSSTDLGAQLYAAHNMALEARAQAEAAAGGIPGQTTGPVSSKSVDKVSVGYDTGAATEKDAGHWNNTIYGTRFFRFAKLFGAGPIQVSAVQYDPLNGPGWPGPNTLPGMSNFGS